MERVKLFENISEFQGYQRMKIGNQIKQQTQVLMSLEVWHL